MVRNRVKVRVRGVARPGAPSMMTSPVTSRRIFNNFRTETDRAGSVRPGAVRYIPIQLIPYYSGCTSLTEWVSANKHSLSGCSEREYERDEVVFVSRIKHQLDTPKTTDGRKKY